ncbi:MAG: lactate racemase domain-containing protein [Candidatus Alcyoniella australis]|nr:lactate racemase domain-containing protein [Candidatus Alcyoniella australis]
MTTRKTSIQYGADRLTLPPLNVAQVLRPRRLKKPPPSQNLLADALHNPIGTPRLRELAAPSDRVSILLSDPARKFCKAQMLDAVLDELHAAGVPDRNIGLIIACGMHQPTVEKRIGVPPELLERYSFQWHDCQDRDKLSLIGLTPEKPDWTAYLRYLRSIARVQLADPLAGIAALIRELRERDEEALRFRRVFSLPARLGVVLGASLRTPVQINRAARESDLLVCLGQVKPHYFAGFGGGAKSVLPGISSRLTIGANHAMKTHPRAMLGMIEGNVARQDMEDAARLYRGKLFILNVCQDAAGRTLAAASGDVVQAHRQLVPWLRRVGQVKVERRTPIVIAGQGMPAGMSLYQMTKTVAPAAKCVQPGGCLIIAGPCPEGLGDSAQKCEAIFRIGLIKYMPDNVKIMLVSEMRDHRLLRNLFCDPCDSMERALDLALARCGHDAEVTVLPNAGPLIPVAPEEDEADLR